MRREYKMIVTVLESNFNLDYTPKESMLAMEPTQDMHAIEEMEAHYDKIKMPYALVECRMPAKRLVKDVRKEKFLGWSLITQLPLW